MMNHVPAQLQDQDDKTWITLEDAARILNISEATVRGYVSKRMFQRSGKGSGLRLSLADVRQYDRLRNPDRVAGGKNSRKLRKPRSVESTPSPMVAEATSSTMVLEPNPPQPNGVFEKALRARSDLADLNDRLTILLTRKAELEEVVRAVEAIERFARLTPETGDVDDGE